MINKLNLQNATVKYGGNTAVNNISLSSDAGDMIFITGANGSGKSTLIKAIAGLLPLSSGKLERTNKMSYVPQVEEADKDFPAKVHEIILTGRQNKHNLFYNQNDKMLAKSAMLELGIYDLAENEIKTLSGGQFKRVLLARALCGEPELLLLDEPCAGLDAESHNILFKAISRVLAKGCAVLMVTHDDSDLAGITPYRLITLSNGKIIHDGIA